MPKIVQLKDSNNENILPVSNEKAIYDDKGTRLDVKLSNKQDNLISGTNIKTINGQNLLGNGNIEIQGGSGGGIADAPADDKKYVRSNNNWVEETKIDTSNFVTNEELPDISDMLTKTEASTTYQPIGDYALKSELPKEYTLPIASDSVLGGIKIGNGLSIDSESGIVSVTNSGGGTDTISWDNVTNKPETFTPSTHNHQISEVTDLQTKLDSKQDNLVSGTNIKTINGQTLLGEGDITIEGGGTGGNYATKDELAEKQDKVTKISNLNPGTIAIKPNTFYDFGEITKITITFEPEVEGILNEYLFKFSTGGGTTTLNLPSSVKWIGDKTIGQNKTYIVSIVDNLAVIGGA